MENSLGEKILVFHLENGYIFNLFEKAKGLSYEVQIFTRDSSDARLSTLQRASSYSDRKCPFEGLEDRLSRPKFLLLYSSRMRLQTKKLKLVVEMWT